jgi:hypothetical protein
MTLRLTLTAGASVAALILGLVGAVTAAPPAAATVSSQATNAVNYAHQHGYRSAVAVIDTQTGTFSGAGDYSSYYASESVMKVFIATRLLMTGQMSGWNETTAYKMITQSDDASANALYGRAGGDGVITWIKQALNIPNLGAPPLRAGWWGGTRITAAGMATFYNTVRRRPAIWNWLGSAMHHATRYGSDGTYQFFGIPSATTGAGIKQGWGGDDPAWQPAYNSTGLVNGDRYAVVILTQGGSYGSIPGIVTGEAKLLMPGGKIAHDDPLGRVDVWRLYGRYLKITGWAFDPNATTSGVRIWFHVNGTPVSYVQTTVPRPDVNAHYKITGNHGFATTLKLNNGANTVCAYAMNLGAGHYTEIGCKSMTLTGQPVGYVDSVVQKGNLVTLRGWSFDYDAPSAPLTVVARVNGALAGKAGSTILRRDINTLFHGSGLHGFTVTVRVPAGASTVCIYALNTGPGSTGRPGCRAVQLRTAPLGRIDSVTVQGSQAVITGWAFDFSSTAQSIGVIVTRNGTKLVSSSTTIERADVNRAWSVTGRHGFSYTVKLAAGTNQLCAYGVNVGAGANALLGCRSVAPAAGG